MKINEKTLSVLTILLLSFVFSCKVSSIGRRNIITLTKEVSDFNEISVKGNGRFNIHISQGEVESIKIITDDILIELVEIKVIEGVLQIKGAKSLRNDKIELFIDVKQLNKIICSAVADIKTETIIIGDKLKLYFEGVGNVNLSVENKEFSCLVKGVGNMKLFGKTDLLISGNYGVGNLNALELIAKNGQVESQGVGNTKINVTNELQLVCHGFGNVLYKGSPKIIKLDVGNVENVKSID